MNMNFTHLKPKSEQEIAETFSKMSLEDLYKLYTTPNYFIVGQNHSNREVKRTMAVIELENRFGKDFVTFSHTEKYDWYEEYALYIKRKEDNDCNAERVTRKVTYQRGGFEYYIHNLRFNNRAKANAALKKHENAFTVKHEIRKDYRGYKLVSIYKKKK